MYKAIIIEDNPSHAALLKMTVAEVTPEIDILGVAATVEQAISEIKTKKPEILFLDIELGSVTCFDLFKNIELQNLQLIFVSGKGSRDRLLNVIKLSAVAFVRKPYTKEEVGLACKKAVRNIEIERKITNSDYTISELTTKLLLNNLDERQLKRIHLSNNEGITPVALQQIICCSTTKWETSGNREDSRIMFRLLDGSRIIISNTSVAYYAELLKPFGFAEVDKAIVNIQHIAQINKSKTKVTMVKFIIGKREEILTFDILPKHKEDFIKQIKKFDLLQ